MFKMIALLKRKSGITTEEFIDLYEQGHSKFAVRFLPKVRRYERRYIRDIANPVTGVDDAPAFDVVTEVWWDNRADFEAAMAVVGSPENAKLFEEDEEKLFDRPAMRIFVVEHEGASDLSGLQS